MHRGYTTPLVIAIMAFAIVAFLFLIDTAIMPANSNQVTNRTTNTNTNVSIDTSPTVDIPTDDWKTFSDTSTGVSIHYPQDWQEKSCGDAMIIYFAPEEISCGAGLNAIGLQRTTSDQTVSAAIANRQTQVEQTTVLQLTVAGLDAQRLIGSDPQSALGGSETQQNDEIYFRQDDFLWSLSSTLEDDGRIFLAMADTLTLSKPATTDPTAGWKTFENTQYHWTLKYPADWEIVNDSDDPIMGQVFFSNSFNVSNTKYASLDAWKKQMLSYESEIYKVTISSTTVDGLDALWVDVYSLPSETPFFSNIGVWKDGLIVNFAAKEKDKMPQDVVRSFTFTD